MSSSISVSCPKVLLTRLKVPHLPYYSLEYKEEEQHKNTEGERVGKILHRWLLGILKSRWLLQTDG